MAMSKEQYKRSSGGDKIDDLTVTLTCAGYTAQELHRYCSENYTLPHQLIVKNNKVSVDTLHNGVVEESVNWRVEDEADYCCHPWLVGMEKDVPRGMRDKCLQAWDKWGRDTYSFWCRPTHHGFTGEYVGVLATGPDGEELEIAVENMGTAHSVLKPSGDPNNMVTFIHEHVPSDDEEDEEIAYKPWLNDAQLECEVCASLIPSGVRQLMSFVAKGVGPQASLATGRRILEHYKDMAILNSDRDNRNKKLVKTLKSNALGKLPPLKALAELCKPDDVCDHATVSIFGFNTQNEAEPIQKKVPAKKRAAPVVSIDEDEDDIGDSVVEVAPKETTPMLPPKKRRDDDISTHFLSMLRKNMSSGDGETTSTAKELPSLDDLNVSAYWARDVTVGARLIVEKIGLATFSFKNNKEMRKLGVYGTMVTHDEMLKCIWNINHTQNKDISNAMVGRGPNQKTVVTYKGKQWVGSMEVNVMDVDNFDDHRPSGTTYGTFE